MQLEQDPQGAIGQYISNKIKNWTDTFSDWKALRW